MKKYLQGVKTFLGKYGKYLPYISTILPFIVGYLSALLFSRGDVRAINFFINEIGIVSFWLNGLVASLTILIQLLAVNFLIDYWIEVLRSKTKMSSQKIFIGSAITGLAISVLSLGFLLGVTVGIALGAITVLVISKKFADKKKEIAKFNFKKLYLILGVYVVFTAIVSYPSLLVTKLVKNDGNIERVQILTEKQDYYLAQNEDKKIVKLQKVDYKAQSVCNDINSVFSKTIPSIFFRKELFDSC